MVLKCPDLAVTTPCCAECTVSTKMVIYPPGLYGPENSPDLGMGIRGLVCCRHIHVAQRKSRKWWYEEYLRRSKRFNEDEIHRALHSLPLDHYRIFGEIHAAARLREQGKVTVVQRKRLSFGFKKCPECGSDWNETVCNNCGHI